MTETIKVEVCYALPAKQELVSVKLPAGATLGQALEASGLLLKYPEIDLKKNKFGIYAKLSKPDAVLRDRDRVEIYRPLIADPKEVRKQRAAEGKVMKKGAGDTDAWKAESRRFCLFAGLRHELAGALHFLLALAVIHDCALAIFV
jgi:putative ubiquitin-RnfH superfamily antitoxin RatB of RatAB toxin-antitoxin module